MSQTQRIAPSAAAPATGRILVVDDHARARESMADVLRHVGYEVDCSASAIDALRVLDGQAYDVVISDLKMPGMDGLEFIRTFRRRNGDTQVVMVTAHATVGSAVEAMRHGVFDYIEKPLRADQLEELVARAMRNGAVLDEKTAVAPGQGTQLDVSMIGSSRVMQALRHRIAQVAPTSETVLITGESGTGKELVCRSIHAASNRANQAMVSLNCPVLSAHLMESELFGHERGAFTSADAPRVGRFELAEGGTILLDEITEIDLSLQAKLLRVLQEKTFERIGSSRTVHANVRVLATTNRDLRKEVAEGRFREDLYFRLAVVPITVPPLRERSEDVVELIEHFRGRLAARLGRQPCELTPQAKDLLVHYHWPGNIRELENILTRASVLSTGRPTGADELREWLIDAPPSPAGAATAEYPPGAGAIPVGVSLQEMERKLIEATLAHFAGHRQNTADALGIGVRTLSSKLRGYGLAPRAKTFAKAA